MHLNGQTGGRDVDRRVTLLEKQEGGAVFRGEAAGAYTITCKASRTRVNGTQKHEAAHTNREAKSRALQVQSTSVIVVTASVMPGYTDPRHGSARVRRS